jgi:hypothetical protein
VLSRVNLGPRKKIKLDDLEGKFQHNLMTMGVLTSETKTREKLEELEIEYFTALQLIFKNLFSFWYQIC